MSKLWFKIWWDVVNYPNTSCLQLCWGSWALTGWNVAWTAKKTKYLVFARLDPTKFQLFLSSLQR